MSSSFNDLLRAKAPVIVDRALALLGMRGHDIRGYCLDETTRLVDFVLAAKTMQRSALFVEYVVWVESVMKSRRTPLTLLRAVVAEIGQTAEEIGGDDAAAMMSMVDEGLARIGSSVFPSIEPSSAPPSATASLSKTYLELLLAAKRKDAVDLINRALEEGLSLEDIYLRVLQPAMREVGLLWQMNQISVAQEHYVSAATQLIVSQLYPRLLDGPRHGKMMIAGSVESNLHEIGLRFLCDIFELRGWDTHFYGANTPTQDLLQTIRTNRPDIVAVGATLSSQLPPLVNFIKLMRNDPQTQQIPILVGGAAFWGHEDLWKEMGADGFASDATRAVALANELTGAV